MQPLRRNFDLIKKLSYSFYTWLDQTGRQPTPGAEAFAFNDLTLPLYIEKGPGEVVRNQLFLTAPQYYLAQQVIPTGIAGTAAGTYAVSALMENPNGAN